MGMPRGSRWKRLAVFSSEINSDKAAIAAHVLRSGGIDVEWWTRTIKSRTHRGTATNPVNNLGRDLHPKSEEWLMVRRGDWPMAFVLVKDYGVYL